MVNKKVHSEELLETDSVSGQSELNGRQTVDSEPVERPGETSLGLDENVAATLSYLLGFVTGILVFLLESENRVVRFHAAQSTVVFGGIFVFSTVFSVGSGVLTSVIFGSGFGSALIGGLFSIVFGLVGLVLSVGSLVLWLYLMVKAYTGETPRIPIAAGIADDLVD